MRFIFRVDQNALAGLKIDNSLSLRLENAILKASLTQIYSNWVELANRELNSTRENYIKGIMIQGGQTNRNTGSISLKGVVNNMLENGCSAFDMKTGFAKSEKRKFNKNGGWYLTIPISDKSKAISVLMNSQLPQEIFSIINQEVASTAAPVVPPAAQTNTYSEAQGTAQNKGASRIPKSSSVINNINQVFNTYKGQSQITSGQPLVNSRSVSPKFFRVGEKSDPSSWIHKGLTARNFGKRALEQFKNEQQARTFQNVATNILKEQGIL